MTETETRDHNANKQQSHRQQNGDVATTVTNSTSTARDDVFDDTYKEKQGPKPAMRLVWRNIILMSILHTLALYGVTYIPSAMPLTLAWCKLKSNSYKN